MNKKSSLIIFWAWVGFFNFLAGGYCNAQTKPRFKKGTDTAYIRKTYRTAFYLTNADSSIPLLKGAVQKCLEGDYFWAAAAISRTIGVRYNEIGNLPEAMNYYTQALAYATKADHKKEIALCHNDFGVIYQMHGNSLEATEEFFKALSILKTVDSAERGPNFYPEITINTNLALIYGDLGQNDKFTDCFNQAELITRTVKLDSGERNRLLAKISCARADFFCKKKQSDSVVKYCNEAQKYAGRLHEKVNQYLLLANCTLAELYLNIGEYEKAITYSRQIIPIAKNNYGYIAYGAASVLADALYHTGMYKESEALVLDMLKEKEFFDKKYLVEFYSILDKLYRATKQYEKALNYLDSAIVLHDTLMNAEKARGIAMVDARYHTAEKDIQITKNELLIAQQKNKITRKNIWIGSISSGVFMLGLVSIGLYRNSRRKQVEEIRFLKQQNTISILKGVVQGEENERIRLARDLHDGIGGMLSAIKMRFMALRHNHKDLTSSSRYLEAMGLLDVMGDEIRKTSHNLMPEVLLKQGLDDALQTYCINLQEGTTLRIDFQSFGSFDGLANDFKLNIYRIAQELLKNTLQHAKATYVVVQLMMLEDYLTINVEDNGIGFNADETKDGIGLQNLKTRVLSHEGHYTLKSEQGKGTTVFIEFKMKQHKHNENV